MGCDMYSDQLLLNIFDTEFNHIAIIDNYTSLIWTERYQETGDFELEVCYSEKLKEILKQDYYCRIDPSERTMIIEKVQIERGDDGLSIMTVSGRSLESILDRRIVFKKQTFGTKKNSEGEETKKLVNIQDSIKTLFDNEIISPENEARKISNFNFIASEDTYIKDLKFNQDYDGDSMLDVIEDLCSDKRMGYKILQDEENNFNFQFYKGVDRSMEQSTNEVVIFSENYDNLISSEYYSDKSEFYNVLYVTKSNSGTGDSGSTKIEVDLDEAAAYGLSRRETTCSESDLQSKYKTSENKSLSKETTKTKGRIKLKKDHKTKEVFEGDISYESMFVYPDDYRVGDKVQFIDIFGNNRPLTVTEMVIGRDDSGYTIVPTFEDIDEGYDPDLDTE